MYSLACVSWPLNFHEILFLLPDYDKKLLALHKADKIIVTLLQSDFLSAQNIHTAQRHLIAGTARLRTVAVAVRSNYKWDQNECECKTPHATPNWTPNLYVVFYQIVSSGIWKLPRWIWQHYAFLTQTPWWKWHSPKAFRKFNANKVWFNAKHPVLLLPLAASRGFSIVLGWPDPTSWHTVFKNVPGVKKLLHVFCPIIQFATK